VGGGLWIVKDNMSSFAWKTSAKLVSNNSGRTRVMQTSRFVYSLHNHNCPPLYAPVVAEQLLRPSTKVVDLLYNLLILHTQTVILRQRKSLSEYQPCRLRANSLRCGCGVSCAVGVV